MSILVIGQCDSRWRISVVFSRFTRIQFNFNLLCNKTNEKITKNVNLKQQHIHNTLRNITIKVQTRTKLCGGVVV